MSALIAFNWLCKLWSKMPYRKNQWPNPGSVHTLQDQLNNQSKHKSYFGQPQSVRIVKWNKTNCLMSTIMAAILLASFFYIYSSLQSIGLILILFITPCDSLLLLWAWEQYETFIRLEKKISLLLRRVERSVEMWRNVFISFLVELGLCGYSFFKLFYCTWVISLRFGFFLCLVFNTSSVCL